MRIFIIGFFVVYCIPSVFSQDTVENRNVKIDHRVGIDFGFGNNSFSGKKSNYSKFAMDIGVIYELNHKLSFGLDLSFSPLGNYENTGVDGSRSTHFKWDCSATCIETYCGYLLFKRVSGFAGFGTCFSTEYEVMKGYSNLTAYERNSMTYFSPIIGITYGFPKVNFAEWYLKYDMAIGEYDRFTLSVGLKI